MNGTGANSQQPGFTVALSSVFIPSHEIFTIWLNGHSVEEAVELITAGAVHDGIKQQKQASAQFILSQYRQFGMMEHFLHRPRYFGDQFLFSLPLTVKKKLIEMYYAFDENVVRELLGKKLNYRSRKDLDDVCAKTRVSLGSCRRQVLFYLDFISRISKKIEELPGFIVENIEKKFLLSLPLASQYAHIIFLTSNRIETGKKKLSQFTFADFEYCSSVFMKYWTTGSVSSLQEFDSSLIQDLREIKTFLISNKEVMEDFKNIVHQELSDSFPDQSSTLLVQNGPSFSFSLFSSTNAPNLNIGLGKDFSSLFKSILRNMVNIGIGLSQPKEVRDIFVSLLEKIVEICVSAGWRGSDAEAFFIAVRSCWIKVGNIPKSLLYKMTNSWERLTWGVQLSSLRLFNDLSVALSAVK